MDKLTLRERLVFEFVVAGLPNEVIAARLRRSERTIKLHKKSLTKKMRVSSAVALLQLLVGGEMAPPHLHAKRFGYCLPNASRAYSPACRRRGSKVCTYRTSAQAVR